MIREIFVFVFDFKELLTTEGDLEPTNFSWYSWMEKKMKMERHLL